MKTKYYVGLSIACENAINLNKITDRILYQSIWMFLGQENTEYLTTVSIPEECKDEILSKMKEHPDIKRVHELNRAALEWINVMITSSTALHTVEGIDGRIVYETSSKQRDDKSWITSISIPYLAVNSMADDIIKGLEGASEISKISILNQDAKLLGGVYGSKLEKVQEHSALKSTQREEPTYTRNSAAVYTRNSVPTKTEATPVKHGETALPEKPKYSAPAKTEATPVKHGKMTLPEKTKYSAPTKTEGTPVKNEVLPKEEILERVLQTHGLYNQISKFAQKRSNFIKRAEKETDQEKKKKLNDSVEAITAIIVPLERIIFKEYNTQPDKSWDMVQKEIETFYNSPEFTKNLDILKTHRGFAEKILAVFMAILTLGISLIHGAFTGDYTFFKVPTATETEWEDIRKSLKDNKP